MLYEELRKMFSFFQTLEIHRCQVAITTDKEWLFWKPVEPKYRFVYKCIRAGSTFTELNSFTVFHIISIQSFPVVAKIIKQLWLFSKPVQLNNNNKPVQPSFIDKCTAFVLDFPELCFNIFDIISKRIFPAVAITTENEWLFLKPIYPNGSFVYKCIAIALDLLFLS